MAAKQIFNFKLLNKLTRTILFFSCIFASVVTHAVPMAFSVLLTKMEVIKEQEKGGDELYLHTTEYPHNKQPKSKRTPGYPRYWKSNKLKAIKKVPIYNSTVERGKANRLLISLVEHDISPLNADDHLGSLSVLIANKKGKIITTWKESPYAGAEVTRISNKEFKFSFKTDEAEYRLTFKVIPGRKYKG